MATEGTGAEPVAVSSAAFRRPRLIRFAHCDPAGIVYFPRWFDLLHSQMEDFFGEELGFPYASLIGPRRLGFPTVRVETDFRSPGRQGERPDFILLVERIGRTSLQFLHLVEGEGRLRLQARQIVVTMDLVDEKPVAVPADLLAALEAYRSRCAEPRSCVSGNSER